MRRRDREAKERKEWAWLQKEKLLLMPAEELKKVPYSVIKSLHLSAQELHRIGLRKTDSGRDYEPVYSLRGEFYEIENNHRPDGKFKKGNKTAVFKSKKKKEVLSDRSFEQQLKKISQEKLSVDEIGRVYEQLLIMAKNGNLSAIKYLLDRVEGTPTQKQEIETTDNKINWKIKFAEEDKEVEEVEEKEDKE